MALLDRRLRAGTLGLILGAAAVAGGALSPAARAEALDVFTIDDVPVDATASTVYEAREVAIAQGRARAWRLMLQRLTLAADHPRLPPYDASRADEFFKGFGIDSEKSSAVRYLGRLTYVFHPDPVRRILRERDIPFAETVSRPVLVLPLYREGDLELLWDEGNPWREAWDQRPTYWGLVPFVVPLGDLADIADVDVAAAALGDVQRISRLIDRYGAGEALVAEARVAGGRLEVTARRYGGGQAGAVVAGYDDVLSVEPRETLTAAVQEIVRQIDEHWKQRNLLGTGQEARLIAEVPFESLREWQEVRGRLKRVAAIRETELLALGRNRRQVGLSYLGGIEQLTLAMAQQDLLLERDWADGAGPDAGAWASPDQSPGEPPTYPGADGSDPPEVGGPPGAYPPPGGVGRTPDEATWIIRLRPDRSQGPAAGCPPGEGQAAAGPEAAGPEAAPSGTAGEAPGTGGNVASEDCPPAEDSEAGRLPRLGPAAGAPSAMPETWSGQGTGARPLTRPGRGPSSPAAAPAQ